MFFLEINSYWIISIAVLFWIDISSSWTGNDKHLYCTVIWKYLILLVSFDALSPKYKTSGLVIKSSAGLYALCWMLEVSCIILAWATSWVIQCCG